MATLSIADTLKYANLQMAAEALYGYKATERVLTPGDPFLGSIPIDVLTDGNLHTSKFTKSEAGTFSEVWEVVEHESNTTTGFSGTLFRAKESRPELGITKQ